MRRVYKILLAIVIVSLLSCGILALLGNYAIKKAEKEFLEEVLKNVKKGDKTYESFKEIVEDASKKIQEFISQKSYAWKIMRKQMVSSFEFPKTKICRN